MRQETVAETVSSTEKATQVLANGAAKAADSTQVASDAHTKAILSSWKGLPDDYKPMYQDGRAKTNAIKLVDEKHTKGALLSLVD